MKKLIYIEENFISPDECQKLIDLSLANKGKEMPYGDETRGGDTFLTTVTHSDPTESLTKGIEWKDHTAVYLGGNVEPTIPSLDDKVVTNVNDICKSFDPDIILDYVGVVRWPVGTFMKPHFDKNDVYGEDVFAAMLYLNDDFEGGSTMFEHMEVKPETGKLIVFSNSKYLHYVTRVDKSERYVLSFWYKYPESNG